MSTRRKPRWEVVTSDAGHHVRFRASNGRIVVSSEVYANRRAALRAIQLVTGFEVVAYQDGLEVGTTWTVDMDGLLEVREVDERGGSDA